MVKIRPAAPQTNRRRFPTSFSSKEFKPSCSQTYSKPTSISFAISLVVFATLQVNKSSSQTLPAEYTMLIWIWVWEEQPKFPLNLPLVGRGLRLAWFWRRLTACSNSSGSRFIRMCFEALRFFSLNLNGKDKPNFLFSAYEAF